MGFGSEKLNMEMVLAKRCEEGGQCSNKWRRQKSAGPTPEASYYKLGAR